MGCRSYLVLTFVVLCSSSHPTSSSPSPTHPTLHLRGGECVLPSCSDPSTLSLPQLLPPCFRSSSPPPPPPPPNQDIPHVIFVLGGPGSGKGTQCEKLCAEFRRAKHLSAGDLLRAERNKKGSEQGEMINRYMKEGKIIPVEVTAKLLRNAIERHAGRYDVFLIDGFPRDAKNVKGWDRICGSMTHVELMIMFECSEEVMTQRLLRRGQTSGRVDDNMKSIRKRLKTYLSDTMPVVRLFEKMKKLRRINSNRPINQVYAEVRRVMEPIMERRLLGRRLFNGRLPSVRTLLKGSLVGELVIRGLQIGVSGLLHPHEGYGEPA